MRIVSVLNKIVERYSPQSVIEQATGKLRGVFQQLVLRAASLRVKVIERCERNCKMSELARKKKLRGGHRVHAVRLIGNARELIESFDGQRRSALEQTKLACSCALEESRRP